MQNRRKKIKIGNFIRHAWQSIWFLSGSAIINLFWLTACQQATVPLEKTERLSRLDVKATQIKNGQNNKNSEQTKKIEENKRTVKFELPRSIIVIDEVNETQNPYRDQLVKDTNTVQQTDQTMVDLKTAAESEAANAVINSITWQFQSGEKDTKILAMTEFYRATLK